MANEDIRNLLSRENLGNFVQLKNTQGFDLEIWNYEAIGTRQQLRDSLRLYYNTNPLLEYVLLIGDVGGQYIIDSFEIPSYNEPQGDVTDHPFTYFNGGVDTQDGLVPNFLIGRWSVSDTAQVKTIQVKTVSYLKMENIVDPSYVENALLVAGNYKTVNDSEEVFPFQWPITPMWTSLWLQNKLMQYGYAKVDTALFHKGYIHEINSTIEDAWNSGVGIINYRGWGNAQGWLKPEFVISDINDLNSSYQLPVVFSFVCNTGDFGNQSLTSSFGEELLRSNTVFSPKGAVAMVGPSDLDTDTRFNNVMCAALWDGLLEGRTPELAQALHEGKQAVKYEFEGIQESGAGGTQDIPVFYHHVYNVLGDPSLPVWLKTPSELISDGGNELELTNSFISIRIGNESGEYLQDVVGALLYEGNLIAKGLSTQEGYLDVDFTNLDIPILSEMELYLNKPQYYQKKIAVIYASAQGDEMLDHTYMAQDDEVTNPYSVQEIGYNWIELNPEYGGLGENLNLTDDTIAKDVPIGFDFTYYGYTYSTINICSNGWTAFEEASIPYFWNFSIPFPIGPYAMLAVYMDDLDDDGKEPFNDLNGNGIYDGSSDDFIIDCGTEDDPIMPCHDYNQNGIRDEGEIFNVFKWFDADNHRFIVQWDELSNAEDDENCNTPSGCVKETFQLLLYDPHYYGKYGQGNIVFQYMEIHDIDDGRIGKNGNLSTIGIESPDQNEGLQYLFRGKLLDGSELAEGGLNKSAIQFSSNQAIETSEGTFLEIKKLFQPIKVELLNSYPNPFNPVTTIRFELPEFSRISLEVFNIKGQHLETLISGMHQPGSYSLQWNGAELPSGLYFVRLTTPNTYKTQKILLLK